VRIFSTDEEAAELSRELRLGSSHHLRRRRRIIGLSTIASGSMALITLYQTGLLRHLPEPPLAKLDADRVDASSEAYSRLRTPDAAVGLASYATTIVLAAMGGEDRAQSEPWIVLALAGKLAFDAANAIRLTIDQAVKQKAYCFWCLIAATVTLASAPLVVPEAREALRALRGN
jgi:uncharacterized membrane protein